MPRLPLSPGGSSSWPSKLAEIPDFVCQDVEFFESLGTFYKVSERMIGETLKDRLNRAAASSNPELWSQADRA